MPPLSARELFFCDGFCCHDHSSPYVPCVPETVLSPALICDIYCSGDHEDFCRPEKPHGEQVLDVFSTAGKIFTCVEERVNFTRGLFLIAEDTILGTDFRDELADHGDGKCENFFSVLPRLEQLLLFF